MARNQAERLSSARAWISGHPVVTVLLLALALRILAATFVSIVVGFDSEELSDAQIYDGLATQLANGDARHWDVGAEFYFDRFSTFVVPVAALYKIFGDHLYLAQLVSAAGGAVTAALVCRILLSVTSLRYALVGGVIVAVSPSQIVWSSVAYRDSFVWMVTAAMALVCVFAVRQVGWKLLASGAALTVLAFLLGHLRWATMIVACWALVVAAVFGARQWRLVRVAGALVIVAIVPWYIGAGFGGADYAGDYSPAEVRGERQPGAETALPSPSESTVRGELSYLPRGLSVLLLEPVPWTTLRGFEVRVAQLELVFWYPLLVVAALGVPAGWRRRSSLSFLLAAGGGVLVVYALAEGNFGTAYRHRSELVPVVAVLAALGAPTLVGLWERHRRSAPVAVSPAGRP